MYPSPSPNMGVLLSKIQARQALSVVERRALLGVEHVLRDLRRHEYIVRENQTSDLCCVLLDGFAMRHKVAGNGGRQIFSIHMRGDVVDLQNSLLGTADHNIQMLSDGRAAFIQISALRKLFMQHPLIAQALWRETLIDAAIFREWTLNVGRRDARASMAHLLCEFAIRLEHTGLGQPRAYVLPMTQEELADALGLTPIHVSRTLKSLTSEGLVERTNRSIRIVDWRKLAKLGDFDSRYLHLPQQHRAAASPARSLEAARSA